MVSIGSTRSSTIKNNVDRGNTKDQKLTKFAEIVTSIFRGDIIEQDHRKVKWKMNHAMGFHSMISAEKTITGIETMHQIRKGQTPFMSKKDPQLCRNVVHRLFDITGHIFPTYHNRTGPFAAS